MKSLYGKKNETRDLSLSSQLWESENYLSSRVSDSSSVWFCVQITRETCETYALWGLGVRFYVLRCVLSKSLCGRITVIVESFSIGVRGEISLSASLLFELGVQRGAQKFGRSPRILAAALPDPNPDRFKISSLVVSSINITFIKTKNNSKQNYS